MTRECFEQLLDELDASSLETLKTKNAKYSRNNDPLHNFHTGCLLDNSTTAQTIWHYMKKHVVALLDKIENDEYGSYFSLSESPLIPEIIEFADDHGSVSFVFEFTPALVIQVPFTAEGVRELFSFPE